MIIQNKKTGQRQYLTPEQWKTLQDVGFAGKWNIISRDPPIEEPKIIPLELTKFAEITKKKPHGKRKNS